MTSKFTTYKNNNRELLENTNKLNTEIKELENKKDKLETDIYDKKEIYNDLLYISDMLKIHDEIKQIPSFSNLNILNIDKSESEIPDTGCDYYYYNDKEPITDYYYELSIETNKGVIEFEFYFSLEYDIVDTDENWKKVYISSLDNLTIEKNKFKCNIETDSCKFRNLQEDFLDFIFNNSFLGKIREYVQSEIENEIFKK